MHSNLVEIRMELFFRTIIVTTPAGWKEIVQFQQKVGGQFEY